MLFVDVVGGRVVPGTSRPAVVATRHKGALEWLQKQGFDVSDAKASLTSEDITPSTVIIGNVPMWLACQAYAVAAIEFTGTPPRGAEYTVKDMEAAGARLVVYMVSKLD